MTGDDHALTAESAAKTSPPSDSLSLRVASSLVLAPLGLAFAYAGGWPFALMWAAAAILVQREWTAMLAEQHARVLQASGAALLSACFFAVLADRVPWSIVIIAAGALVIATVSGRRGWNALGLAYSGVLLIAPVVLRRDADMGFAALAFLFVVVWATDIGGYFAGRFIGGPKLWPRVSPKKTWAGAIGGALGALICAAIVWRFIPPTNPLALMTLTLLLSVVSQAGDLIESAVKRRFGVKDAGHIIPGHGGVMDRLDGFLAAALVAAVIGVARAGVDAAGRGLLTW